MNPTTLKLCLMAVLSLVGIGLYGLMICRNLIKMVIVLQILVKAAALGLILAGQMSSQINLGQSLGITVIVADTIVAVVGMALAVQVQRRLGTLDVDALSSLRG
ncbi:MAG TPA: NADH-quinone oxidoreductase subunit K [Anaerolineae bacterium]|nr:NADH-quinone oxidoreductase subunit K [Anaerolineae bacterium]